MLCVVIKGPSLLAIKKQIEQAAIYADLFELRFDLFDEVSWEEVATFTKEARVPLLFTYKEAERGVIEKLLSLEPDYIDIEIERIHLVEDLFLCKKKTLLILSFHDFSSMPQDLEAVLMRMKKYPAFLYKIAVEIRSSLEALKFLLFMRRHAQEVVGVGMGELGQVTRILSPVMGSFWTYAAVEEAEYGQLQASYLETTYHFSSLNKDTKVYGLIGYPVTKSISEITHNAFFRKTHQNAVYVKMPLMPEEVASFLPLGAEIFSGLSVTMPLKELLTSSPVNTLVREKNGWCMHNTDGIGAIRAIEKYWKIKGAFIALIGTGGTAKAIAIEAKKRGAHPRLFSRDISKEEEANREFIFWDKEKASIVINCTPIGDPKHQFFTASIFMEVKTIPIETEFTLLARANKKKVLYGYELFIEQAKEQFTLFGIKGDLSFLQTIVEECIYQVATGGIEHKIASGFPPDKNPNLVPLS